VAQHFQIQHLALSIDDPERLIGGQPDKMLGMFRQPFGPHELAPGRLRMEVHSEANRAVHREALPHVWKGAVDGLEFAVSRHGSRRRIELPGRAVIDFDIDRGWAQLCMFDTKDSAASWFLLLRLVCDSLTRGGHSFIHAACLAVPRGRGWGGVVLSAPSNTGKTTTALALADSGWRLLGDDVTYVRPSHLGSMVWGFPRACHVRPGTLEMLPWVAELELAEPGRDGTQSLPIAGLRERGWVAGPWLPPTLVVALAAPNRRATTVEHIDRAEALSLLGAESINAAPDPNNEDGARDFVTLGRLVCAAPACRLSVGPEPRDAAAALEAFLEAYQTSNSAPGRFGAAHRRAA
jgi:hypothetical protein